MMGNGEGFSERSLAEADCCLVADKGQALMPLNNPLFLFECMIRHASGDFLKDNYSSRGIHQ